MTLRPMSIAPKGNDGEALWVTIYDRDGSGAMNVFFEDGFWIGVDGSPEYSEADLADKGGWAWPDDDVLELIRRELKRREQQTDAPGRDRVRE